MKILFYVLWYFAIAFASMICWVKFPKLDLLAGGDGGGIPSSAAIVLGTFWPVIWPCWLVCVFLYQLYVLLNKIKNT